MFNSVTVGLICVTGSILISFVAAYTFNHFNFLGKNFLFLLILALMMIPGVLTLTPSYLLVTALRIKGTWLAVILPGIAGGQVGTVFLFRVFLSQQPRDLFEAGRIDGASEALMMFRISLPLALPIVTLQFLNTVSASYNDYIWPLLVLDKPQVQLLMPLLKSLTSEVGSGLINVGKSNAMFLLSGIPLIIGASFGLRYFIGGDFAAGMKM